MVLSNRRSQRLQTLGGLALLLLLGSALAPSGALGVQLRRGANNGPFVPLPTTAEASEPLPDFPAAVEAASNPAPAEEAVAKEPTSPRMRLKARLPPPAPAGRTSNSTSPDDQPGATASFLEEGAAKSIDPTVCDPPCLEGRGVCNDNRCFCVSPYEGTTCQHTVKIEKRVGPTLTTGLLVSALIFGMMVGFGVHQLIVKLTSQTEVGAKQVRKETWKPSEAEPKKKAGRR